MYSFNSKVVISLILFICNYTSSYTQMVSTYLPNNTGVDEALFRAGNGQLYGTGYLNGTLNTFNNQGVIQVLDSLSNPSEMAELSTGEIAVAESQGNRILLYDTATGNHQVLTNNIQNPAGIIKMTNSDTLLVSSLSDNNIYQISPNGEASLYLQSNLLNVPVSFAWDDSNNLYIANYNNGVILKKDQNNNLTEFCDLPTTSLGHIVKVGNALFATGVFSHKIYKVDLNTGSWNIFA